MILVILGICIALFVVGVILNNILDNGISYSMTGVGFVGGAICLVAIPLLIINCAVLPAKEDELLMYQEENASIETKIEETVKAYQKYETDAFSAVSKESAITLVSLYPELKADTLVQKQIETYTENNNKIKEIKTSIIYGDIMRWWLYFGGGEDGNN